MNVWQRLQFPVCTRWISSVQKLDIFESAPSLVFTPNENPNPATSRRGPIERSFKETRGNASNASATGTGRSAGESLAFISGNRASVPDKRSRLSRGHSTPIEEQKYGNHRRHASRPRADRSEEHTSELQSPW